MAEQLSISKRALIYKIEENTEYKMNVLKIFFLHITPFTLHFTGKGRK